MASQGSVSASIEAIATTIGAGMVIGGFLAGVLGIALGWKASKTNSKAMRAAHYGGVVALIAVTLDGVGW
jgi:hypothetical protein